jgi:hypothetical protein
MTIPAANVALLLVVIVIVVASVVGSVVRSVVWSVVVVISTLLLLRGVAHRGVHFVVLGV